MRRDGERRALGEGAQGRGIIAVPTVLAGALDVPRADVQLGEGWALEADLVVRAGGDVVDVLDAAAPGPVTTHAEHVVTAARKLRRKATPLPTLPYMTAPRRARGRAGRAREGDVPLRRDEARRQDGRPRHSRCRPPRESRRGRGGASPLNRARIMNFNSARGLQTADPLNFNSNAEPPTADPLNSNSTRGRSGSANGQTDGSPQVRGGFTRVPHR